jgi:endonuclease/exonuclease/phosphatase family metal-dependent hydrolase
MQNILTAIDTIMKDDYNKHTNYVFLQECTPKTLLEVVASKSVPDYDTNYQILNNDNSEFCLIVRKSAMPKSGDIIVFDFYQNKDGSPAMSKYISDLFYSYDIEVNTSDLKKVMCYIVKSTTTIFFNVHFPFDKSFIFRRQTELYNFMNAIVYSIRSIPKENTDLYPYQNYDIVFTGDFNVNMLQRFPQDVKRFGYPDSNKMIPIFFTCNYIKGQKTIISTTYINIPSARAKNGPDNNYNLTNIDFSILYPRIGNAGTGPIEVTILNDGIPKKTLPIVPVGSVGSSAPGSSSSSSSSTSTSASTPATTLKVMSFNTWYKPFNAQKKNDDGNPQEPGMQYCNVTKDGTPVNVCQENIMKEIMTQIEKGFQVIFLQEFTSRIQEVFDKCKFSAEYVGKKKQIPFTMTYTPPGGKGPPLEYYVYSINAQGETIITLCSRNFFPNPATQYYMGNLTGFPNNPSYANGGDITKFWDISGGGRPYIVLVFDDIKMILINIHGPHGGTFNPYLQKVSVISDGKPKFIPIGVKNIKGTYDYNPELGSLIPPAVQTEIDKKIEDVEKLNGEYKNLQDYTFRQLGDMLRKRIPNQLKTYKIIFAGDFNMRPDDAKTHLVKLSERLSSGKYGEGPFSNSSGDFDKQAQNSLKLKVGDTDKDATGTCCVTNSSSSYGSGIYDQIYSNKLKVTKYWTYGGNIEYDKTGGILFSDHLPVYAEIELPASGPSAPASSSSGGSKRFTLRNNINNNNNNNKPISRKIRKSASAPASMPTTKITKKQHSNNKKHKTRRHKH